MARWGDAARCACRQPACCGLACCRSHCCLMRLRLCAGVRQTAAAASAAERLRRRGHVASWVAASAAPALHCEVFDGCPWASATSSRFRRCSRLELDAWLVCTCSLQDIQRMSTLSVELAACGTSAVSVMQPTSIASYDPASFDVTDFACTWAAVQAPALVRRSCCDGAPASPSCRTGAPGPPAGRRTPAAPSRQSPQGSWPAACATGPASCVGFVSGSNTSKVGSIAARD